MTEKTFKGYIVLDWRTGQFRVKKTNPIKTLKPSEIPIEIDMKVKLPEKPPMTKINGEIEISTMKVKQIILETLEEGSNIK